jgi:predicted phosphodiesterase
MRIAAIYDIHGNLPALEAVLAEIRGLAVDLILVGGDVVPGPMPRETIDCLLALDTATRFIRGNGEREILAQRRGDDMTTVPEQYRPAMVWVGEQLDAEHERALASWPLTARIEMDSPGMVLFCHATPRNDTEIFTRLTPDERLLPMFAGVDASLVACGHTHMQFTRTLGAIRIANAGSVGMPFGKPGAFWLLLGPDLELRRTSYDLDEAARRIRATSYPQAAEFADRYVLHPPAEAAILQSFAAVELR